MVKIQLARVARGWLPVLILGCAGVAQARSGEAEPNESPLSEALVIGGVGRFGRTAVHADAIENMLVTGTWTPPQDGTALALPDGETRQWHSVQAAEGVFRDDALAGGYAYVAVDAEKARIAILAARGHSLVYVNGVPRVGDPYQTGFVRLPVRLERGRNELLFVCGRGELRASLIEPPAAVIIDPRDSTLPDLLVGKALEAWGAVVVINCGAEPLTGAQLVARCGQRSVETPLPRIPACGTRKVAFRVTGEAPGGPGEQELELVLYARPGGAELARERLKLQARPPGDLYKRTFISDIDGSVQYYAVRPVLGETESQCRPALILSLHGAGVEASGQAACYAGRDWALVAAPTNRRPYGFDWEDWGRLDALEVLTIASREFGVDPSRVYLTGHSMGGHGTWQIGATFPDRFAAIAPSAGWISFWSYTGAQRFENATPVEQILTRATNPSDTLALERNCVHHGIYVLHGDADDNVPVEQARSMRSHLSEYHADFAYYERPGAGHWWGNECVDWPPLVEFLRGHQRPPIREVKRIEFVTANPAVSATCDWATIEAQSRWLEFSKIELELDKPGRRITGTTENVERLKLTMLEEAPGGEAGPVLEAGTPVAIELDDQELEANWPENGYVRLERLNGNWKVAPPTAETSTRAAKRDPVLEKGPRRAGPFKEAFRNHVQFVYGTHGSLDENVWAATKARYDAETFWYRGNGSIDVLPDTEFDPAAEVDRNVILYGNSKTNGAWPVLLASSPVQVSPGAVQIAETDLQGDDLAVLAVYPRPGSATALVGIVGGTGLAGMRVTERLPVFVSGVAYPDWIVLSADVLRNGTGGIRGVGFFGTDWQFDPEQSAWNTDNNNNE